MKWLLLMLFAIPRRIVTAIKAEWGSWHGNPMVDPSQVPSSLPGGSKRGR